VSQLRIAVVTLPSSSCPPVRSMSTHPSVVVADQFQAGTLIDPAFAIHVASRDGDTEILKALITNNNDNLEEQIPWYGTPLHIAIRNNHVEAVKILLSAGANMESLAPDESGAPLDTALTLAARQGRREIVKLLWDQGASRKGQKLTALELAATYGFDGLTGDLLSWWEGWTSEVKGAALWRAAKRWNCDVIRVLLQKIGFQQEDLDKALLAGAAPKVQLYDRGIAEGYSSTEFTDQENMIKLLIDAGANPNTANGGMGFHPIHIAVGKLETVGVLKILLEKGADPNSTDDLGRTALGLAAHGVPDGRRASRQRYPHTEGIDSLLQHGASLTLGDNSGDLPITVLARNGPLSLFQSCLERIVGTWPRTVHRETLLHAAVAGDQVEIVKYLLSKGVDVN